MTALAKSLKATLLSLFSMRKNLVVKMETYLSAERIFICTVFQAYSQLTVFTD